MTFSTGGDSWDAATAMFDGDSEPTDPPANVDATRPFCSVWWKFTASADGPVTLSSELTTWTPDYDQWGADTYLKVYTGGTFASRVEQASNDDTTDLDAGPRDFWSIVTFDVVAGTEYHVQLGAYSHTNGVADGIGQYILTATGVGADPGGGGGGGGGSSTEGGGGVSANSRMVIQVLDPSLKRAPTSATLVLIDGAPDAPVDIYIDGEKVATAVTDTDGGLEPMSIPVLEPLGAGTHTVTATQGGSSATATFTLQYDPNRALVAIGPDADPFDVPGSTTDHGTRKWVFQDLLPSGLGSWVMPINPKEMTPPYVDNALASKHTTARSGGQWHISQGGTIPREWSFSGEIFDEESYQRLQAYRDLNRRFYIIDARGRAWISVITDINWDFQLQKNFNGQQTDWAATYQATVIAFNQEPIQVA